MLFKQEARLTRMKRPLSWLSFLTMVTLSIKIERLQFRFGLNPLLSTDIYFFEQKVQARAVSHVKLVSPIIFNKANMKRWLCFSQSIGTFRKIWLQGRLWTTGEGNNLTYGMVITQLLTCLNQKPLGISKAVLPVSSNQQPLDP